MKTLIWTKIADLNTNRARVIDDPSRGALAATLLLTNQTGVAEVPFDCRRTYSGGQTLEFAAHGADPSLDLIRKLLDFNLIPFMTEYVHGRLIRVSVLELLDKGWTLVRQPGDRLCCVSPAKTQNVIFSFVNDGTNLWAEYDGTSRVGDAAICTLLETSRTKYEVIE